MTDYSAEDRRRMTAQGHAIDDEFPVANTGDLGNAVSLYVSGHKGPHPKATAAYLRHRAAELGAEHMLQGDLVAKDAQPSSSAVHVPVPLGSDAPRKRKKPKVDAEMPVGKRAPYVIDGLVPIRKQIDPARFTFSPVYVPNLVDAHGEWADVDDLQKAVWDLSEHGDRTLNLQHIGGTDVGRWVELACIPWEHEVDLTVPGVGVRKTTLPANTPWMGVIWSPWAFEAIQKGRLRGLSMEGTALRTVADIAT